ncbi:hypothetical protein THAOC_28230 [Thalassiosira oceanica]|uniref:Uncharacterized protein n=1 Tax=Thalassiosira oceanica TaxID=159749 RepID=K0RFH1_THAOC|nr:hypothetical protein THAOC_28230 [Thalassiosira oceanica]|eukprot:EJK52483.1 hypothetical protein THAOC_28230 [Thalassiosira oceanica]
MPTANSVSRSPPSPAPCSMSSPSVNYDALEAKTSIEEITENELNQRTLQRLRNDDLTYLFFGGAEDQNYMSNYILGSSTELGWLGHFMKKSTRLNRFGIVAGDIFDICSMQSVDRFLEDLSKCIHIKARVFAFVDLAEIIYKLKDAITYNITGLIVESCYLGVPETTFLFNTLRDVNNLEELCINCDSEDADGSLSDMLDDDFMAKCIPSLAACKGMRKLKLAGLNLSTKSCAALSALPWLSECKQMQELNLITNRIGDDGLDVLIQGLPASIDGLHLDENQITLARQLPLLRFKELYLSCNALSLDGPRVITASLANPECRLEDLFLDCTAVGDKGAAILAEGVRNNQRLTLMSLNHNNITERGWNAFSSILCDASSINATYNSNHTLQDLGDDYKIPHDILMLLELNRNPNKSRVAANKILQVHRHLDMRPFFGMGLDLLPHVVAWLERFAESRPDLKLTSIFEFVRGKKNEVSISDQSSLPKLGVDAHRQGQPGARELPLKALVAVFWVPIALGTLTLGVYGIHPVLVGVGDYCVDATFNTDVNM